MDESGQPGGEPAEVNGDGAHGKGVARADANGWRQPERFGPRSDAEYGEAVRSAVPRSGPAHTADAAWSAGSREPAMEPIPSWRRSAITQLTDDRPEPPRRLADLLAPVSPPVPPQFPFDNGPEPDGRLAAPEPLAAQTAAPTRVNGSSEYVADRSFPPDGRQPDPYQPDPYQPGVYQSDPRQHWATRGRAVPEPTAEPADPFGGFDPYRSHVAPPTFEDLPTLAEAAAATRGAHQAEAAPEPEAPPGPVPPMSPMPEQRSVPEPAWAHEPSWHRERPWSNGGPLAAPPWADSAMTGSAPLAQAHPPVAPANPPVAPRNPAVTPTSPTPAGQPGYLAGTDGSVRFNGSAPVSPAVPFDPRTEAAMHQMGGVPDRPETAVRQADPPGRIDAKPGPQPLGAHFREPVAGDPWEDPERRAAAYRESMSGIRAASMGVAAAEARAAAEDRAAVQAAYSAAVEGPNTPLGQPSLGDHADRHSGAYHSVPPREQVAPREAVIPRQPGPADRPVPTGTARPVPGQPSAAGQPAGASPAVPATGNAEPIPGPHAAAKPPAPAPHPGPGQHPGDVPHPGPSPRGGARPNPESPAARSTAAQPPTAAQPSGPQQPAPPAPSVNAQQIGHGLSALPVPPVLPQRVPAAPDVPELPDDDVDDDDFVDHGPDLTAVNPPELARIATGLRYNEDFEEPPRPDGFDTLAVLAAVRAVPGVRDAQLRPNPTGGGVHTLRLDLADGADGAQVSRLVARLLKQRMGLAAEPRRVTEGRRAPVAPPNPNTGQPHREANGMPVAGTAPTPRIPMPVSAAEQLTGPVASAADDRARRRPPVPAGRARALEHDEPHRVIHSATAPRVVIDQVQVSTLGLDATVEVRLASGGTPAIGVASGPAVDGYVLRLAAVAATAALDQLLAEVDSWEQPGRCFVEHATVVPFGSVDVAVVIVLLVCGSSAEQLTGSALVNGDPRQAVVRATLAAMNRRLDTLLS